MNYTITYYNDIASTEHVVHFCEGTRTNDVTDICESMRLSLFFTKISLFERSNSVLPYDGDFKLIHQYN